MYSLFYLLSDVFIFTIGFNNSTETDASLGKLAHSTETGGLSHAFCELHFCCPSQRQRQ